MQWHISDNCGATPKERITRDGHKRRPAVLPHAQRGGNPTARRPTAVPGTIISTMGFLGRSHIRAREARKDNTMTDINVMSSDHESLYPSITFKPVEFVPDALLNQITTSAGAVEGDAPVVRVPVIQSDAPAAFVKEGAQITEGAPELAEMTFKTAKIATLFAESNESSSYGTTRDLLVVSIQRKLTNTGDAALLANKPDTASGTDWQPTGLLNMDVTNGPAWGTSSKAVDVFDALNSAITTIEGANGTATHIVMSPSTWGYIRSVTNGTSTYMLGNPGQEVERTLWGVPVITNAQMPDADILVLDKSTIISATTGIKIAKGSEAYFNRDSLAWRATWRFGWGILNKRRIVKLTKTAK